MLTDDWSPRRWRVALVAHDAKEAALVAFVLRRRAHFKDRELRPRSQPARRVATRQGCACGRC